MVGITIQNFFFVISYLPPFWLYRCNILYHKNIRTATPLYQNCVFLRRRRRDLKSFAPTRRNSRLVPYRSRYSFSPPISPSLHLALRALGLDALAVPRQGSNLDFDEKRGQTIRSILFFG